MVPWRARRRGSLRGRPRHRDGRGRSYCLEQRCALFDSPRGAHAGSKLESINVNINKINKRIQNAKNETKIGSRKKPKALRASVERDLVAALRAIVRAKRALADGDLMQAAEILDVTLKARS